MEVADRIEALLRAHGVPFERLEHGEARSAEEIARIRGTPLAIGGKAIVMKLDKRGFAVLAIRGCDAIDNRALRRWLGLRRYRFATREELRALTGLVPGRIPPFGRPIFDLPLYVDRALADNRQIAFTPGLATRSLRMATADWLRVARPEGIHPFGRPAG